MTSPDHFRLDYAINPWMRPGSAVDPARVALQWQGLRATLERLGARVNVLPGRPDAPDMVYAMNLGLVDADAHRVLLSHMRHPQRRMESASAERWFTARGYEVVRIGADGVGPHVEAGDAFPFGDALVVAGGLRTGVDAWKHVATALDVRVRGVHLVHPAMYHLDLAFCPLDERRAMICPDAFDDASLRVLLDLVPEPLLLSAAEAFSFVANAVVVGDTVVVPACPDRIRTVLEGWGFAVEAVDLTELHLGGGSARCLTNPLDWSLADARVPGGEVLRPA